MLEPSLRPVSLQKPSCDHQTTAAAVVRERTSTICADERSSNNDSRQARSTLNALFKELQSMLAGRLRLFGRRSPASRVDTPLNGEMSVPQTEPFYTPSLDEEYLREQRRTFILDLCKILDLDERKLHTDFFDRPLLYPYFLQTSSDLNRKPKMDKKTKILERGCFPDPTNEGEKAEYCKEHFFKWAQRAVDNTRGITFGIWDCCYSIYGDILDISYFKRFICEWLLIFLQGRFSKIYKLQTTLLFCVATKQTELPEYEESDLYPLTKKGYLAGGKLYRYIRNKMNPDDNRHVPFFYSIMQSKRCTQSLSWKDEASSLIKHRKNMKGGAYFGKEKCELRKFTLEPNPFLRTDVDEWVALKDLMVQNPESKPWELTDWVKPVVWTFDIVQTNPCYGTNGDTTDEALNKIRLILKRSLREKIISWRPPSINSTFTHSRAKCGAQGWFSDFLLSKEIGDQLRERDTGFFVTGRRTFVGYLEEGWKPEAIYMDSIMLNIIENYSEYLYEFFLGRENKYTVSTDAQVHTVLEPLKARIITSGDAPIYHYARMIQKVVHSQLRRDKYMALMGRRHESSYFAEEFIGKHLPEGWFIVAGDYDAATDGMNPKMSVGGCDAIADVLNLSEPERVLYRSTMTGHTIHYPKWFMDYLKSQASSEPLSAEINQCWGQLMGSPSSFPLLCLVNLAGFWVSVEKYLGRTVRYEELDDFWVRVNGDDIVFIANEALYEVWSEVMKDLGLTPSIGKNFQASNWMMINSTCYWVDFERDEEGNKIVSNIRDMDHIDPGLVSGRSKVQGDTRHEDLTDLGLDANLFATCSKLRQAVKDRSSGVVDRMTESFLYHNGDALKQTKRSWTLPDTLGGLGLPGDINNSTRMQKLVAMKMLGSGSFENIQEKKKDDDLEKIFSPIELSTPDVVKGNTYVPYKLGKRVRNTYRSGCVGFPVPDFSHLEISDAREVSEGTIFERTLRRCEESVRGVSLDFLDKYDFNTLRDFKNTNEESMVRIRPSFRYRLKYEVYNPNWRTSAGDLSSGSQELLD